MLPVHQSGFWAVKLIGLADKSVSQYFYLMSVLSKVIDTRRRLADTQNVCEHCMFTVQGDCALFALYSNCAA